MKIFPPAVAFLALAATKLVRATSTSGRVHHHHQDDDTAPQDLARNLDAGSCHVPSGLVETLSQEVVDGISGALSSPELPYLWIPLAFPFIGELVKNETPIQFRLAQIHGSTVYHSVAKYHPVALDIW